MEPVPRLRGRFGRPFTFVEQCTSTQRLLDGAPEGAVAAAGEQTEGRGRLGRTWHAPVGTSLLFSIVLEPRVPPAQLHELSLVSLRPLRFRTSERVTVIASVNGRVTRGSKGPGVFTFGKAKTIRTLRAVARDAAGNESAPVTYPRR